MKAERLVVYVFLWIFTMYLGQARASAVEPFSEIEILARLDAVTVSEIQFDGVELSVVMVHLQLLLGAEEQVRFRVVNQEVIGQEFSLHLKGQTLAEVLSMICQQLNYSWTVEAGLIVLGPGVCANRSEDGQAIEVFPYVVRPCMCCFGDESDPFGEEIDAAVEWDGQD